MTPIPETMTEVNQRLAEASGGWWTSLAILLVAALLGSLARTLLFRHLRRLAERTATRTDDLLLEATRRFWLPAILFAALLPAARLSPLSVDQRLVIERFALSALLLVLTLATSRFVGLRLRSPIHEAGGDVARPSVMQKVAQFTVLLAGALLIFENAGVDIKTLLTALGVGSLAVALALQPTLSNLFAGIHLSVSRPIRVGDFIELEDGTQGHVLDIGWRTTRILQPANSMVIVPNARLSDMRLVNYSMPETAQTVVVKVGVGYGSDLRRAVEVAREVARAVQAAVPEADTGYEPGARFTAFGDSAIELAVSLRTRDVTDRFPLVHEFLIRLHERFAAEGIEIPFPQRVVRLEGAAESGRD